MITKEAEKILKRKDLKIEIQGTWKGKARVIPVIIGATGTSSKSLRQYLSNIGGKHEITELKKSHIEHCTHTAKRANIKVQNIFHGRKNIRYSKNCKCRTSASLYTLEIWFVSGI